MVLVFDTATTITGSRIRACRLPLMDYLAEKMCALCYERAWNGFKMGSGKTVQFLKALLFVMMDLTGEVEQWIWQEVTWRKC